ncbi:MAG: sugar transferase [Prevotellaceae bacterium]|nr:sugar transferase [Prevotellaceae bacterium]
MNKLKKKFYIPATDKLLIDLIAWVCAIVIMLTWRSLDNKLIIFDYAEMFLPVFLFWSVVGYLCQKYRPVKKPNFIKEIAILISVSCIVFGLIYFGIVLNYIDFKHYSKYTAMLTVALMILFNLLNIVIYYSYLYASNYDVSFPQIRARKEVVVMASPTKINEQEIIEIKNTIREYTNQSSLDFIEKNIDLTSSNTKIIATTILANIKFIRKYHYDAIVNLAKINQIRGINRLFVMLNQKLPDNGIFCCCFESIEQFGKSIEAKFPPVIRQIVKIWFFIQKRVLPKMFFTNRLWFDITKGRNRVFSNVEVLGRLYYCGFEVLEEFAADNLTWIIAKRKNIPQKQTNKLYGLIIKLPRVGKNRKIVYYYKIRTMFPYSEYIQKYIYEKQGTDEIGKVKNDIRITRWGKVFRKLWIDELPMIFNLLKGDLKIVGVRPLSKAFFEKYPPHLQEKRTLTTPGLIPPFYVDLPKSEQEIFDSEERYLNQYLKSPLKTDIKYFFKATYNILIKKARSH